jgi:hypothetical protein
MSSMGLIGLRALALNDTQPILDRMRGFEHAPHPTLALTYTMANAIHLNALGRLAEVRHFIEQTWSRLEGGRISRVTTHERRDLTIGLLLLQGMNETWPNASPKSEVPTPSRPWKRRTPSKLSQASPSSTTTGLRNTGRFRARHAYMA